MEMQMNENEKILTEAFKSFLDAKAQLGLKPHEAELEAKDDQTIAYLHGHINEMFAHKAAELTHYDGVKQAFSKVHGYKYITDPDFIKAMDREMIAQGIPGEERGKATGFVPKIIEELGHDKMWLEQDFGFHPDLKEIMDASRPEQYEEQD
jgi:hypothetical protein